MDIVYYLLPIALSLGGFFLVSFLLAARAGEFDDLETPAHRILLEDTVLNVETGETKHE